MECILLSGSESGLPRDAQNNPAVQRAFSLGSDEVVLEPLFVSEKATYYKVATSDISSPQAITYISRTIRYVRGD